MITEPSNTNPSSDTSETRAEAMLITLAHELGEQIDFEASPGACFLAAGKVLLAEAMRRESAAEERVRVATVELALEQQNRRAEIDYLMGAEGETEPVRLPVVADPLGFMATADESQFPVTAHLARRILEVLTAHGCTPDPHGPEWAWQLGSALLGAICEAYRIGDESSLKIMLDEGVALTRNAMESYAASQRCGHVPEQAQPFARLLSQHLAETRRAEMAAVPDGDGDGLNGEQP